MKPWRFSYSGNEGTRNNAENAIRNNAESAINRVARYCQVLCAKRISAGKIDFAQGFGEASVINMAKQPGDLQFYCMDSGTSRLSKITHVTMVASPTQIVHARGTKYGVCTNSISLYAGKVFALALFHAQKRLRRKNNAENAIKVM